MGLHHFHRQSWYRTDSLGNRTSPGPGPASVRSTVACVPYRRLDRGSLRRDRPAQQGGMAVSHLDGRGLSLPFLIFRRSTSRYQDTHSSWVRSVPDRELSHSRDPLAATSEPGLPEFHVYAAYHRVGLVARPPSSATLGCFARSFGEKPDCLSGAFSFFAGDFHARRRVGVQTDSFFFSRSSN